jgi:amino acid adenylation domain-containing protein/non-ribosomal peptide synthase protein (TIGR01720 family)
MQDNTIEGYRLSPQQQRQWILQQHSERSPYRVQVQVLIEGNVDTDALLKALFAVISRHEILNTTFQHLPGMSLPVQVINKPQVPSTQIYDLSHLNSSAQEMEINALFQQALELPFDLQQSPPIHLFLIKLQTGRQILILGLPALCSDRPGLNRLVYELSQSYAALLKDDELPPPEMQFADLAEWQHELLESEDTEAGRDYWRKPRFVDGAQLELSFEQKRKDASFQPRVWTIALSPEISVKLEKLSQEYKVTEAALLQSCWQILLWRLTQSSGLIVATSCDGRNNSELKGVLGLLSKYLPAPLDLHAGLAFHEVASQVHELVRGADDWQEYFSFDQIIGSHRSGNHLRFFPFSFDYDEQQTEYVAADINFTITRQYDCIEPYKLKLSGWRHECGLIAELHYDSSLFNISDIERLAGEFQTIVAALFNHPEIAIGQAEILSPGERYQLLVEWNQTAATYPQQYFHQMFEAQVERDPEAPAVICEDERISYRELNNRANQLAHYLQKQGIGPEVRTGVLLERSPEMVVAILGVLKAGGAYVPLDQSYPKERLTFLQDDADLKVLLTQTRLAETFSQSRSVVINIDEAWEKIEQESVSNPISQVRADNLAYVIYTSGSTGKPKGVMIPHYGLVNYLSWCTKAYAVAEGQGSAVHSSISFDLTITSLFAPLVVGGRVVLLPEEQGIEALAAALSTTNDFSLIKITPAHLDLLRQMAAAEKVSGKTRAFIIGGEELLSESLEFWRTHAPATRLINEYGPTEAVVGCCVYEVDAGAPASGPVPIGKPIANTELYIVDERLEPAPIGVSGELLIGGAGLARGYMRRPELTAEKFVPHPFSGRAGARLYRTGDLGRYQADGQIEFLGRRDQQVKLRGYRIELGEIEAVLRSQSGVQDAVVVVQEGAGGEKRLVGYVVRAAGAAAVTMSEWRSRLSEQLPEYMLPAVVVELGEWPLTANGKVDRRALPEPDGARPELGAKYEGPRNEVEAELCRIWAGVLGLQRVGIHDNFFDLGGDSILSIQIVARANQKGLRLAPRQLFEQRTIAALATAVNTTPKFRTEQGEVSGEQRLTPIQQWFFAQQSAELHHWNQAVLLSIKRPLQPELLKGAVGALLRHHDALRLRFNRDGEGWRAHYAAVSDEAPSFTVHDLSGVAVAEQRGEIERLAATAQTSLDLSEGPLLQVQYYKLGVDESGAERGRLLIVVHHLAMDIVSWRMLLEDLQQGYKQLEQGAEEVQLPAKTTSYQQWAEVLQEYAQSEQLAAQVDYWTNPERGGIARLPVDGSGTRLVAAARLVTVRLAEEETQWLLTEVPKATRAQVHEVLLTALGASLSEWGGEKRVLIDVESHGREETVGAVDLTRTVGWFTVLYPLLVEVGEGSWSEKLRRVKEQQRQAPQGGIGYGVLRYLSRASEVRKKLAGQPQAEVSFNYVGRGEVERPREEALVGPAQERSGVPYSPRGSRCHMLEINASMVDGELVVHWIYSEGMHRRETIEQVAQQMLRAISEIIRETRQSTTHLFSTADFPDAELSQQELDKLMAVLD